MTVSASDSPIRAFLNGLLRPSLSSLLGAVLVALLLLLGAARLATPPRVARFCRAHDVANVNDATLVFTVDCLTLGEIPPEPGALVVLGPSDLMEAIWSDESLSRAVEADGGGRREIRNLSFRGMWIWDMIAAIDSLPPGFDGTVVVGVSVERMASTVESYLVGRKYLRWGFRSELLDAEARRAGAEPPPHSGLWFADNLLFLRGRWRTLAGLLLGTADPVKRHYYLKRPPWPGRLPEEEDRLLRESLSRYPEEWESNEGRLRRAIEVARERGRPRFVFVEGPRNPGWADGFYPAGLRATYRDRMARFAAETGAVYVDLNAKAVFEPEEFADYCHLRSEEASRRFTRVLGARLATILRHREKEER